MKRAHLLIANRGEIAVRIAKTARALGYRTTAVYSEADAHAPHVRAADGAVAIGPAPVGASYLNAERIVAAARAVGAGMVHPGYGLLSENAGFARACGEAGLIFVGPSPESIALMADKRTARAAAQAAGVPCVPGHAPRDPGEEIEESDEALASAAETLGYPVMIKAAAGGGGRGMRRANARAQLLAELPRARSEAEKAFGDGRLLLERVIERARHIEVQVLADSHGRAVHLGERDCSLQRRFQKVIEECPSPAVDAQLRAALGQAALALVRAAGYVGAGTVEFLVEHAAERGREPRFYFLEMNTRLQVEHPVTELVTGLDLVALQLQIAEGAALPIAQDEVILRGHAVEARVYAEDPAAGFLPQTGRLLHVELPVGPGVRVDHALEQGQAITPHYDPLLAKVIAHGSHRDDALRRLDHALAGTRLLGVRHNRDYLRRVLADEAVAAGDVHTGLLEAEAARLSPDAAPGHVSSELLPELLAVAALCFVEREAGAHRDFAELWGFSNAAALEWPCVLACGDTEHRVQLRATAPPDELEAAVGDRRLSLARPRRSEAGELEVSIDGVLRRYAAIVQDATLWLDGETSLELVDRTRAPASAEQGRGSGNLTSPMEASVIEVRVREGDRVAAGDLVLVLEAMKLEHRITADLDGVVEAVHVKAGDQVAIGQRLVELSAATGSESSSGS